jgi:hypothetical protein
MPTSEAMFASMLPHLLYEPAHEGPMLEASMDRELGITRAAMP